MKPRVYLRLLHPIHAVLWSSFFAFTMSRLGVVMFNTLASTANTVALVALAPYIFGGCIASAMRGAMCRPFFPLLPNARRKLRQATSIAILIVAAIFITLSAWLTPTPLVANAGLIITLLALPLALRGDQFEVILLTCFGDRLVALLQMAPWAFLVCGPLAAALCVARGFSARYERRRAATVYNPIGVSFLTYFNRSAGRRYFQEARQARARHREASTIVEREWGVRRVVGSTWSWMRVVWHTASAQRSYVKTQIYLALMFGFEAVLFPLIGFISRSGKSGPSHFSAEAYWGTLASITASDPFAFSERAHTLPALALIIQGVAVSAMTLITVSPAIVLPISRRQWSQVTYGMALLQTAISMAAVGVIFLLVSLVGQAMTHQFTAGFGVPAQAVWLFAILPILPLLALTRGIRGRTIRIAIAVVGISATATLAATRSWWQPMVLTPIGILTVLAATGASLALLSFQLNRHFRRCDLLEEIRLAAPTGAALLN